jgi:protein-tyrosine phosphatase
MKIYHLIVSLSIFLNYACATENTPNTETSEVTADYDSTLIESDSVKNNYQIFPFQISEQFVAMSPLPGKVNLEEDIELMKSMNISVVVTLVSNEELQQKNLPHFFETLEKNNLEVFHSPIEDYSTPSIEQTDIILDYIKYCIENKKNVLIHCMGGYGRSGTIMGCFASKYLNETDPIQYVRNTRGEDAIETEAQEEFVLSY